MKMDHWPWLTAITCAAAALVWAAWGVVTPPAVRAIALAEVSQVARAADGATPPVQTPGVFNASAAEPPRRRQTADPAESNPIFRRHVDGRLVIDAAVADRLAALAEGLPSGHSLAVLEAAERTVTQGLPTDIAPQAAQLFNQYRAYHAAALHLLAQPRASESVASAVERLDALTRLRQASFGTATAQALFGDAEAQDKALLGTLGS